MGGVVLETEAHRILAQGENKMSLLNKYLISSKRYDDLERASDDIEYREQIFAEMKAAGIDY